MIAWFHRSLLLLAIPSLLFVVMTGPASAAKDRPVKVFILAGQSNMEGKAKVSLLEYQAKQPETRDLFKHLRKDGRWVVRNDVWIKFLGKKGNLTVGFGSKDRIGPELEFGNTVGNHFEEQVLLIKTAWGGKSLARDFRPPSSGLPSQEALQKLLKNAQKRRPKTTMDDIKKSFGKYYREMHTEISDTLKNLGEYFPDYKGQGYEIAGFVWFQGWNDMVNPEYTAEYTKNMVNFIKDVRKDLNVPKMPFVIGQLGVGGTEEKRPNQGRDRFKRAQAAAADFPAFRGNVSVVKTDVLWDKTAQAVYSKGWKNHVKEWEKVGSDYPFHYLGSAKTYTRIGKAFGKSILDMQKK